MANNHWRDLVTGYGEEQHPRAVVAEHQTIDPCGQAVILCKFLKFIN